jgi:hypothetical protein
LLPQIGQNKTFSGISDPQFSHLFKSCISVFTPHFGQNVELLSKIWPQFLHLISSDVLSTISDLIKLFPQLGQNSEEFSISKPHLLHLISIPPNQITIHF